MTKDRGPYTLVCNLSSDRLCCTESLTPGERW
jgi:hypothetical protein